MTTTSRRALSVAIADALKRDIREGRYPAGSRIPNEAELCERFEVSRPTVRAAVKELDVLGLVQTRHGVGTFVREQPSVMDGLERMGSITESIRASGKRPGHSYAQRTVRQVLPDEAERMDLPPNTDVLELRRRITADDQVVAYSFDVIPRSLFPEHFDPADMTGSMFHYFEAALGLHPVLGIARVHAVDSTHIAWGPDAAKHRLFILLDQVHYTRDNRMLAYSRTYFVEGAYAFVLVRRSD